MLLTTFLFNLFARTNQTLIYKYIYILFSVCVIRLPSLFPVCKVLLEVNKLEKEKKKKYTYIQIKRLIKNSTVILTFINQ